jgi:hypothetical protein
VVAACRWVFIYRGRRAPDLSAPVRVDGFTLPYFAFPYNRTGSWDSMRVRVPEQKPLSNGCVNQAAPARAHRPIAGAHTARKRRAFTLPAPGIGAAACIREYFYFV